MYACILETGRGFFEEVYPSSNATAHSCDPPPLLDSRMDSGRDAQAPDPSWFMQNRGYGLSRMHSPRRLVDKPSSMRLTPPGGIMLMVSTRWRQMRGG
jgi:hypothetical protein